MHTRLLPLNAAALLLLLVGASAFGQAPVLQIADTRMGPRLTIHSLVGLAHEVQCAEDLSQKNWTVLTNLVVAQSPYSNGATHAARWKA